MNTLSRRRFVGGAFALSAAMCVAGRVLARGSSKAALPNVMRVRLFAGLSIARVDMAGAVPLTVTAGGNSFSVAALGYDAGGDLTGDGKNLAVTDGPVSIHSEAPIALSAAGVTRHYNGSLLVTRVNGSPFLLVNIVDVESYVASTLASEISPGWPAEAIKAQAIVARTYGLRAAVHSSTRAFDVTDDTSNQVYHGLDGVAPSFVSASSATAGVTLLAAGTPADVFYSAACGGHTADSMQLTGRYGPSYLNGIPDVDASGRAYCTAAPFFAWENSVAPDAMARVVDVRSVDLADITVTERWPDRRVKTIRVARFGTSSNDVDGHKFYARVGAVLGYKVLPSAMFDITRTTDGYTFVGHGLGHGVGMCQWGAHGRADAGLKAEQIVAAYFPGTTLSSKP